MRVPQNSMQPSSRGGDEWVQGDGTPFFRNQDKEVFMRRVLVLSFMALAGCCSIRTTAIDRKENDCLVVNPECPMHGIPVSLRIPTHLELKVIETTYWEKQEIPGEKPTLIPLSTCRATRTVEHAVCYTEKIFLVDPVRPVLAPRTSDLNLRRMELPKMEAKAI